ncbi:HlyC/CorC family transporter [Inmirania thermothiophila]|uniref:Magnesium and cobalt efflux protein CorC n=1 Tax=Inmirania thermothiophila TaxID=1750597 RepID=A0A3N1Y8N6_9GAMM|nr:transporter associated domain-containing protein [Inmirania thermothiophila]ROR34858.1 magnesium and cobalt transporter [Inmirania thermothiophila]
MSEERSGDGASQRSWIERLGQMLAGAPRDREELVEVLRAAQRRGLMDADALAMIEGVLAVSDMRVRDIMIPRAQMAVVERDAPFHEILAHVVASGHSRFPVIGESRDEVVGILLAKDLLAYCPAGGGSFDIREVLRPAVFIPESKRLNVLLKEFRTSRNHLAVVVDEYGGVAGMVTIEDVLEQIVGEIEDEHDVAEEGHIRALDDGTFMVKAVTPIEDFNERFGARLDDETFDTVGGLVLHGLGHVPRPGEVYETEGFRFRVVRADSRRVHLLQVTPPAPAGGAEG